MTGFAVCLKHEGAVNPPPPTLKHRCMHARTRVASCQLILNHYEHCAAKLQSCWHLEEYFLQTPVQQTSNGTLWSFEEKYTQAKPFHLTLCVYPTVAALCQSALIERKTIKKQRQTDSERRDQEGCSDCELRVQCSLQYCSREGPAPCSLHFLW